MVWWHADGSTHVKWDQGSLDVEVTQSFHVDGTSDGIHYWEPPAQ
jgi:hypothetical protein